MKYGNFCNKSLKRILKNFKAKIKQFIYNNTKFCLSVKQVLFVKYSVCKKGYILNFVTKSFIYHTPNLYFDCTYVDMYFILIIFVSSKRSSRAVLCRKTNVTTERTLPLLVSNIFSNVELK